MDDQRSIPLTAETLAVLDQYTDEDVETVLQTLLENTDDYPMTEDEPESAEPPYDAYVRTLEGIDTLAHNLLQEITDTEALDEETTQQAKRRLREVRAQIDPLLLTFRRRTDDTVTDGGVPMITHRGNGVVTHLGPDPVAFAFEHESTDGGDSDGE